MALKIIPLELREANELVRCLHRHHKPVVGHRFSIGAFDNKRNVIVGAAIVGRPVARAVNQRATVEVTRLVTDGTKNACSFLYSAAARIAKELGYGRIQTYILDTESGTSLSAAGWTMDGTVTGRSWSCLSRPRNNSLICAKRRYVRELNDLPEIILDAKKKLAERAREQ